MLSCATKIKVDKTVLHGAAEVVIYDIVGKEISRLSLDASGEAEISKENVAEGIYLFKIFNSGNMIAGGKMIIQ